MPIPTLVATPCPSGPVVASTPDTQWYSGCPGALLFNWRKWRMSSSVTHRLPRRSYSAFTARAPVRYKTDHSPTEAWPVCRTKRRPMGPSRVLGIEAQDPVPDRVDQRCQRHRRTRMARLRLLDRIDGERADRVDRQLIELSRVRAAWVPFLHPRLAQL